LFAGSIPVFDFFQLNFMIELKIHNALSNALKTLYKTDNISAKILLEPTGKQHEGDFTFVVFPFLKLSGKSPEHTAREIGEFVQNSVEEISTFNVVKGFLNFTLRDQFWIDFVDKNKANPQFGQSDAGNGSRIILEYSSPNTNKPQHLGHVRNNLLGFSLSKILEKCGYEVIKANLINDRGIHICKSMLAWQKFGNGETPQSSGIKGDHLVGKYYVMSDKVYRDEVANLISEGLDEEVAKKQAPFLLEAQEMLRKWENEDHEVVKIWETMNQWVYDGFTLTYDRMGVSFDKYYYESNTYLLGKEIVDEGLKNGTFFTKYNGSVWVDLTEDGLDEKLLLRSDGTSVYITQDLGTAQLKYDEFQMDQSIYVVGNEQDYHFKVLKLILNKLGKPYANDIHHLSYGMVDLPSGRMKTREGTVVDADMLMDEMYETAKNRTIELGKTEGMNEQEMHDLFEMIGMGALKFFLLKVDPVKRILFDPNESIDFQGNTGPFIQYTHARIQSILRAASKAGIKIEGAPENDVIKQLSLYPSKCKEAARSYSPSIIAAYIFDLAKTYNRFYHDISILGEVDPTKKGFRITLSKLTGQVIADAMGLLGIKVPEKM
jgi:arginyl-tRNA synthetase